MSVQVERLVKVFFLYPCTSNIAVGAGLSLLRGTDGVFIMVSRVVNVKTATTEEIDALNSVTRD